MKSLLIALVSLFASLSFAAQCPNLSGSYHQTLPPAIGTILKIAQEGDVVNLNISSPLPRPAWIWELNTDGQLREKSLSHLFRDVSEVTVCKDNQIHSIIYGKKVGRNRLVTFTEKWIIYKNTSEELVWQKDYDDDTSLPRLDIYKFSPR